MPEEKTAKDVKEEFDYHRIGEMNLRLSTQTVSRKHRVFNF